MRKTKVNERFLAGLMTTGVLLLFWLVASTIEIHRHSPEVIELPFSDGFQMEAFPTNPPTSLSEIIPELPTVMRRKIPQLPEIMDRQVSFLTPRQRMQTSELEARNHSIQLTPQTKSLQSHQAEIAQKHSPMTSLSISANVSSTKRSLEERRQPFLESTAIAIRAESKKMTLNTPSLRDTTRVLEAEATEKIVQWMRMKQAELPPGIKRHMEYHPGTMTSFASLEYGEENVELYLMVRMPSEELHVVVVRGNATYYVVDPSFKREGRRFRIGVAHRTDGEITAITSEERAASHQSALHHYDVFLAWWDQLNVTLQ